MPSKPTQAEMTEILARGAGCYVRGSYIFDASGNSRPLRTWNPFADPDGLGPIREIEARLSDEQWNQYIHNIFSGIIDELSEGKGARLTGYPGIRHASPAICAEALARTFEPGRF